MPLRTLHAGEGCQRVLACERSHEGFSCESGGGHACRERLPQAGLRSSYRRWAARHSLRPHAGRDRSPRDQADTLEQIHSGSDYRSRVTPQYLPIRASTPGKSVSHTSESKAGGHAQSTVSRYVNLTEPYLSRTDVRSPSVCWKNLNS